MTHVGNFRGLTPERIDNIPETQKFKHGFTLRRVVEAGPEWAKMAAELGELGVRVFGAIGAPEQEPCLGHVRLTSNTTVERCAPPELEIGKASLREGLTRLFAEVPNIDESIDVEAGERGKVDALATENGYLLERTLFKGVNRLKRERIIMTHVLIHGTVPDHIGRPLERMEWRPKVKLGFVPHSQWVRDTIEESRSLLEGTSMSFRLSPMRFSYTRRSRGKRRG